MVYIGIDVGGTGIKIGVVDEQGQLIHQGETPTLVGRPYQEIIADVPVMELYGYNTDLRSMTGGSGTFSYEFARYEQAPSDVQEKEIEARASKVDRAEE